MVSNRAIRGVKPPSQSPNSIIRPIQLSRSRVPAQLIEHPDHVHGGGFGRVVSGLICLENVEQLLFTAAGRDPIPPQLPAVFQEENHPVAVKMVRDGLDVDEAEEAERTIRQEIEAHRTLLSYQYHTGTFAEDEVVALGREHVVQFHEEAVIDGRMAAIFEYIEGPNLAQVLAANGTLPWHVAVNFTWQIFLGIRYMHQLGMIHGDLKPENVMIQYQVSPEGDESYTAKLIDLGLVKRTSEPGPIPFAFIEDLQGTFGYLAPEYFEPFIQRAMGKHGEEQCRVDRRTDYFALGILLYEMIHGAVPFECGSASEEIKRYGIPTLMQPTPSLFSEQEMGNIEDDALVVTLKTLDFVYQRLVEKNPRKRYQGPERLDQQLRHLVTVGNAF